MRPEQLRGSSAQTCMESNKAGCQKHSCFSHFSLEEQPGQRIIRLPQTEILCNAFGTGQGECRTGSSLTTTVTAFFAVHVPWCARTRTPPRQCPGWYLHKPRVLVAQLALGQLVSLCDPLVLEDLPGGQALVRVHMQHPRDQVLHWGIQRIQLQLPDFAPVPRKVAAILQWLAAESLLSQEGSFPQGPGGIFCLVPPSLLNNCILNLPQNLPGKQTSNSGLGNGDGAFGKCWWSSRGPQADRCPCWQARAGSQRSAPNVSPELYLCFIRNGAPVSSLEGKLSSTYPGEDLLWSVTGAVGKWRIPAEG